ncbi:hypothetical protein F4861DRAFT_323707 [Xylaria intraflava]|nr:hypothetical protein F4861DRAFT_323707 [Xylaria intraflava]
MPVANLPVQRNDSTGNPRYLSLDQTRFSPTLVGTLAVPIALFVLVVSLIRKYKTSSRSVPVGLRAATTTGESPLPPKRSREVDTRAMIMSVSREPDFSYLRARGALQQEDEGGKRDSSSSPSRREGQAESAMVNIDPIEVRQLKARPALAVPITSPVSSTTFFSFQDRRPSTTASVHGDFDPNLTQQLNSGGYVSQATAALGPDVKSSSPRPIEKQSYTRILPLDSLRTGASTDLETEQLRSSTFAPSSFPSSNPILPIAPHAVLESGEADAGGEIGSVLDDSGASWKRHTRVYGGGVCLACLASGGHGSDGGFYGENVPLDQRR